MSDQTPTQPKTTPAKPQSKPAPRKVRKPFTSGVASQWIDPTDVSDLQAAQQAERDLEAERPPHY